MLFVTSLVVLFLLNLRFPKTTPTSEVIRRRYGHHCLQVFRKYEQTNKKLIKKEQDLHFLQSCRTYSVVPKFLKFKLYRKSLHNSDLYRKWQSKLLEIEIRTKEKEISENKKNLVSSSDKLKCVVSRLDFICLKRFVQKQCEVLRNNISKTHERKLHNLGANYHLKSCTPEQVIFNYSDTTLTQREKFLLSFGLDFCLPIFKPSFYRYFLHFENIINRLKSYKLAENYYFNSVIECVRNIAHKHYYGFKSRKVNSPIFKKDDFKLLKDLGKKTDLVICKPDKGNGVVLLNKSDYVSKMQNIISDGNKFVKLKYEEISTVTTKLEDKIIRLVNKLIFLGTISKEDATCLKHTGSSPATLYGLPKIHKKRCPLASYYGCL